MNNYINYVNHILIQPSEVKQRFDCSFPLGKNFETIQERALSITQLTLPFLCLYHPLGYSVSLAAGGGRVICHLSNTAMAIKKREWSESGKQMVHTLLAVLLLCSTYFEFKIGLFLSNGHDAILSSYSIIQDIIAKEYTKAGEETLQLTATLLYLSFMLTGTLEYLLALYLIQGAISLYLCKKELYSKRYPEAIACFAMGIVRFNQAKNCYEQIVARNILLSIRKCQELYERAVKGKEARHLLESELQDLDENSTKNDSVQEVQDSASLVALLEAPPHEQVDIPNEELSSLPVTEKKERIHLPRELQDINASIEKNRVILKGAGTAEYDFGAHFHAYGRELVKGANLEFRKVVIDGKTVYELDFKINSFFRTGIEEVINNFQQLDCEQIQAILKASQSHAEDIVVRHASFPVGDKLMSTSHDIEVKGLGKVMIGTLDSFPGLRNRVVVRMESHKNLFDLHELLALTGMETALRQSSVSDLERLKIGHLYRVFFPKAATPFERTSEFFSLPVDELKEVIIRKTPEMEKIMSTYLDTMQKWEMVPGKVRYKITGLASELRARGARYLTAALTGSYDINSSFERVESILKMGLLSNDIRTTHQLNVTGLSPSSDFIRGGADSVFTQMVSDKHLAYGYTFDSLFYNGEVRFLISLEALETGTYQYSYDEYGDRNPFSETYLNRPGITDFVENQNVWPTSSNEVMIKDRVPPSLIKGIVVKDLYVKYALINHLRKANLLQKGEWGVETIAGIYVEQFVQCTTSMSDVSTSS